MKRLDRPHTLVSGIVRRCNSANHSAKQRPQAKHPQRSHEVITKLPCIEILIQNPQMPTAKLCENVPWCKVQNHVPTRLSRRPKHHLRNHFPRWCFTFAGLRLFSRNELTWRFLHFRVDQKEAFRQGPPQW